MTQEIESFIDRLLDYMDPAAEHLRTARERQKTVFEGRECDFLPIMLNASLPKALADIPDYDYKECYYDARKMLVSQLKGAACAYAAQSDAVPSIRANNGTGIVATVLGARQEAFADKMPWVTEHVPKKRIAAMDSIGEVRGAGIMPLVIEHLENMTERVAGRVAFMVSDTQSPFDVAHLVLGDDLFTELYDDRPFVHHLLRLCAQAYIAVTKINKEIIGEPMDAGHHSGLCMSRCGARACEDSTTLVSREHAEEFSLPHLKRALAPFAGGYVHYCGNGRALFEPLLTLPQARVLNFGNPEMHDPESAMKAILDAGKIYYGGWPRLKDESVQRYFERALGLLGGRKRGLIFAPGLFEPPYDKSETVIEAWRRAHGEVFGS